MPAIHVHQSIAADAASAASHLLIPARHAALLAGAQGPDPLFFSFLPGRSMLLAPRIAHMIHTQRTNSFLLALMNAARGNPLGEAYCLGFLSHYAADSICHPYIYARAQTSFGAYSSRRHMLLERQIDRLLIIRRGKDAARPFGFVQLDREALTHLARMLSEAISTTFPGVSLRAPQILVCFRSAAALSWLVGSAKQSPRRQLSSIAPVADPLNEAHRPWRSPWAPHVLRSESFLDLYHQAVARSIRLNHAALRYFSGSISYAHMHALLGGLSYSSGLPWRDTCPAAKAPGFRRRTAESL